MSNNLLFNILALLIFMYYIRIVFVPISQPFPVSLLLPTNWTSCSFSLFQEKKKTKLKPKTTQILQTPKAKEILKQSKEAKLTKKNYGVNFVLSWAWDLSWKLLEEEKYIFSNGVALSRSLSDPE